MSSPRISVNDNDVLLGRGAGTRERKGNRQFLSIVQQYKEVYSLTTTRAEKLAVAREILNRVKGQSPPGRFLEPCEDIRSHELWQEVDFDKAIGKIKQALREPAHKVAGSESTLPGYQGMAFPQPRSDSLGTTISASLGQSSSWAHGLSAGLSSSLCSDPSLQFRLAAHEGVARTLPMVMSSAAPVPGLALASAAILPCPSPLCQNLGSAGSLVGSLFGQPVPNTFSMQQQEEPQHVAREEQHLSCGRQDSKSAEAPSCSPQASQPSKPEKECNVLCVKPSSSSHEKGGKKERNGRRPLKKRSYPRGFDVEEKERVKESNSTTKSTSNVIPTRADSAERIDSEDVEAAQFLLSNMSEHVRKALAVVEQQDEQITEEDRDQAMADMFGALCEINHSKKRSKRPKERSDSLESLLQEMRREIDALPTYEKLALLEAREAASKFEFTDRRLELFLRRESMNAEKAARRFVLYWEERRKLFGPDKYLLPMTLQGALRDDHDCLKNGPLFAAPAVDASGRILGGYILKRQFGENYDSQSVLRVFWFFSEVSAKHPNAADGVVKYMNIADASIWDFEFDFMKTTSTLEKTTLPVPIRGTHVCCVPRMVLASTFIKPLAYSRIDKDSRIRVAIHDCPPVHTADKLKEYGIPAHVVPKEMGGTCDFEVERETWFAQLRKLDEKHALESDEFIWWEL